MSLANSEPFMTMPYEPIFSTFISSNVKYVYDSQLSTSKSLALKLNANYLSYN